MTTKSSFSDFASKHGKDERFKGVDKMRDRENLFNDFITNLRRRDREEKSALKDKVRLDLFSSELYFFSSNLLFSKCIPNILEFTVLSITETRQCW